MRPPYSSGCQLDGTISRSFTPSPILQSPNVWRSLSHDNSIQIFSLDNSRNEETLMDVPSVSNHLKQVDTIYSPTASCDKVNDVTCSSKKALLNAVQTVVALDAVSRNNGKWTDARIIFTPKTGYGIRQIDGTGVQQQDVNRAHDVLDTPSGRRVSKRLCKSDSELMKIQRYNVADLNTHKMPISSSHQRLAAPRSPRCLESPNEVAYVNPLKPVIHSSCFGNVKRVKLKTFSSQQQSSLNRRNSFGRRNVAVSPIVRIHGNLSSNHNDQTHTLHTARNQMIQTSTECTARSTVGCRFSSGKVRRSVNIGGLSDFLRRHEHNPLTGDALSFSNSSPHNACKRLHDATIESRNDDVSQKQIKRQKTTYPHSLNSNTCRSIKIKDGTFCGHKRSINVGHDVSSLLSYIDSFIKSVDTSDMETPMKRPRLGICGKQPTSSYSNKLIKPSGEREMCSAKLGSKPRIKTNGSLTIGKQIPKLAPKMIVSPRKKVVPVRRVVKQLRFSKVTCV